MRKLSLGKWRLIASGVVVVALVLGAGVLLTARGSGTVHASGTGGECAPHNTPVCTFQSLVATAQFTSTDPTGCVSTNVSIFVSEQITHGPPGGPTTTGPGAFLEVFQFDSCHGTVGQEARGFTSSVTFQGDRGLGTATASGTATLTDFSTGAPFQVTFNLTWKGIGLTTREVTESHFHSADIVASAHMTGLSRSAIASGSILEGTANFASTPSLVAEFFLTDSGTITIN